MPADRLAWIALNLIPGIGPSTAHLLAQRCGSAAAVFSAPAAAWQALRGGDSLAEHFRGFAWEEAARRECERAAGLGVRVLTLEESDYPANLRFTSCPPPVLYVRGRLEPGDQQALALVGTRRASEYGLSAARSLTRDLVAAGYAIVSGLARGIDAEAHETALRAGGRTLAVLAHGLDRVYPPEHKRLAERVAGSGAVLSEFPLGVEPRPAHFPRRNRIISGLSQGVVVVEAGPESGALITARWAGEQGRDVFAVPGPYQSRQSRGAHALIQDGAKLITGAEDILRELPQSSRPRRMPVPAAAADPATSAVLTPGQETIRQALGAETLHIDLLAARCRQPLPMLLAELTRLELLGMVRSCPGPCFLWAGEAV
ncbi:MAG: DNA-processing protein DprA [candidate division FCPU426 bacterium]